MLIAYKNWEVFDSFDHRRSSYVGQLWFLCGLDVVDFGPGITEENSTSAKDAFL